MNGQEMRDIRARLRLDRLQFARLLGYTGTDRNDITRIRKYEGDKQQIPLYIARATWLLGIWFDLVGQLPNFPVWPGYEFDHSPDHAMELEEGADGSA